jgi:hypothetical protein
MKIFSKIFRKNKKGRFRVLNYLLFYVLRAASDVFISNSVCIRITATGAFADLKVFFKASGLCIIYAVGDCCYNVFNVFVTKERAHKSVC